MISILIFGIFSIGQVLKNIITYLTWKLQLHFNVQILMLGPKMALNNFNWSS